MTLHQAQLWAHHEDKIEAYVLILNVEGPQTLASKMFRVRHILPR